MTWCAGQLRQLRKEHAPCKVHAHAIAQPRPNKTAKHEFCTQSSGIQSIVSVHCNYKWANLVVDLFSEYMNEYMDGCSWIK